MVVQIFRCPVTVDEIMDFFFKAMVLKSWASGAQAKVTCDPFEQTEISFQDDVFWMLDRFCGNGYGPMSFGTTTIFVRDTLLRSWQPVWMMNYNGWCEKEASCFVKRVLLYAYQQRKFNGGRGLDVDNSSPPMKYRNVVDPTSTFEQFSGFEYVNKFDAPTDPERTCLGWHKYSGMLLLGMSSLPFVR